VKVEDIRVCIKTVENEGWEVKVRKSNGRG
jgi:hypothetical protein